MRFLTNFETLTAWRGYPIVVSALVGNAELVVDGYLNTGVKQAERGRVSIINSTEVNLQLNIHQIIGGVTTDDYLLVRLEEPLDGDLTIRIDLKDPCENPIMLMARNYLGGIIQWLFEYSQEYSIEVKNGIKYNRRSLLAPSITLNEWQALQDFVVPGEQYTVQIPLFSSSTNRTSGVVGQETYVIGTDYSKLGAVVLPSRSRTRSHRVKHVFEIEIELPNSITL